MLGVEGLTRGWGLCSRLGDTVESWRHCRRLVGTYERLGGTMGLKGTVGG